LTREDPAASFAAMQQLRSHRAVFLFWAPLAAQWLMMAAEGPFLAAVIARMGDPVHDLAAYGVAFAIAILVESPVIMLMSAATALVEDASSYRRLRAFAAVLNAGSTALLLVLLVPAVNAWAMGTVLGLPPVVEARVHGALWLLLPWPAAIGYRRFLHGVLIRSGRTRLVAYGTVLRLAAMAATALTLHRWGGIPGAYVGAAALSAGVCTEAVAARWMARRAIRELLGGEPGRDVGFGEIARFYLPLALTSLIGLTVHPLLTFFMGRATFAVESLAVFPVVHGLSFLFRAPGFAYQEAVIALAGRRRENVPLLARFGAGLGLVSAAGLGLVAFTPLASLWFERVSGLTADLAAFAVPATRILVALPLLAAAIAFQHAVLVHGRTTRPVTAAMALEVSTIAALFVVFGWTMGIVGVSAASIALVGGRVLAVGYLVQPVRRVLRAEPVASARP
jgi:progressive ankylosis protein